MTGFQNNDLPLSEPEITQELLRLLSDTGGLKPLLANVTALMQRWSGCGAVGVRLKEGADFPYYVTHGFPAEFVLAENQLCEWHPDGSPVCDQAGNPVLACMCGNVIEGRFDPQLPFFTTRGSFWSNGTTALLASTTETNRQARTRNRCNGEGYESVALIPLRHGGTRFGLLQFNDKQKDRFKTSDILMFEQLASNLAVGLSQRMTDKALRESDARLQFALEGAVAETFELNLKQRTCTISDRWARHLGYEPSEIDKSFAGFQKLLHPDDLDRYNRQMADYLTGKMPHFEVENRLRKKSGEYVWVLTRGKIMERDDDGSPVQLLGISLDISQRKETEETLERNRFFLSKAQEIGRIGTWELNIRDNILQWTDENYRIFGVPIGEKITYERFLSAIHPYDRTDVERQWLAAVEGDIFDVEHRLLVDGEIKWVREKADITRDADGHGLIAIGVTQDITARKIAEAEQEKLQSALLQAHKMESVGRLAGGVAHDFNNMLGVILGHAEVALEKVSPGDKLYEHLSEIQKAGNRSAELTRQLLAFARKQTITPRVLNINEIVHSMLKLLLRLIGEDIALDWHPDAGLWLVKTDATQIEQILANLCVNARDAIHGVGKVTIFTRNINLNAARFDGHANPVSGEYVLLSVCDNGCGIDTETIGHLFEPFFTTKGHGEGTGLGLATVYGIVEQNGGIVTVKSTLGKGSTFEIYLPRIKGDDAKVSIEKKASGVSHSRRTVLLVEDEPALLRLTQKMLETVEYLVMTAVSPNDAIRIASAYEGTIELLLTDVIMPEMNGRDLAARITALHPNLKCLFMSGYPANIMATRGILSPNALFLQKPFLKADLYRAVQAALDKNPN